AVHGANGLWGTIAVGLFATAKAPGAPVGVGGVAPNGLFYGGGFSQLGIQLLGLGAIIIWTVVIMTIMFKLIKKTVGLRVTAEEEITGLDITEHGLPSAYSGFTFAPEEFVTDVELPVSPAAANAAVPVDKAVEVVNNSAPGAKITKVTIITNQNKFSALQSALESVGITGITVTNVLGYGMQKGHIDYYRGVPVETRLLPKIQVDIVICKVPTPVLVETVKNALYTGKVGDGKIFIYDVENVIKVRTGEEGYDALQDE
ncbi:MAG: adenylate cyclase, partial [Oscillospiraceae bacterium]|nr:adenylate cyclase [Oscillospiraceae bacterium]